VLDGYASRDTWEGDISRYADEPVVSLVVPTKNCQHSVEACLSSFTNQNYPSYEVLVVDAASTDGTAEVARKHGARVITCLGPYGEAVDVGFREARGEIVGIFDDDIVLPHRQWLQSAVLRFAMSPHVSTIWPDQVSNPYASMLNKLYLRHYSLIIDWRIKRRRGLVGGGNSLFRKDFVLGAAGTNPELHWGEDFDRALKLKKAGYQVVRHRDPIIHSTMSTFKELYNKQRHSARAFKPTKFRIMDLDEVDILAEQLLLPTISATKDLVRLRNNYWLLLAPYLIVKAVGFRR
jgi:glycosyltransferase involved in cell wall biosynthesis